MRLPSDIPADYIIPQAIREKLNLPSYILTAPIKDLAQVESHVNSIPSRLIMEKQALHVYNDIKTAIFNLCDLDEIPFVLPHNIKSYFKKLQGDFVLEKTKKKFIKIYETALRELHERLAVEELKKRNYKEAQLESTSENATSENDRGSETASLSTMTSSGSRLYVKKNRKQFTIPVPSVYSTAPHKPKLQRGDFVKLSEICSIAMDFTFGEKAMVDQHDLQSYATSREEQEARYSLQQFGGMEEYIKELLSANIAVLPAIAWKHAIHRSSDGLAHQFARVIALTLTDFTSNCRQAPSQIGEHERTAFVKYVVPTFKYLSQETGYTVMSWCEKKVETQMLSSLQANNYSTSACDTKYADGLGVNSLTNEEELFIESSSGINRENVAHSLNDTIKLITECSGALQHIVQKHPNASLDTMCLKEVYGLQVVKKQATLTKVALTKVTKKWSVVELRSSEIPVDWATRYYWLSMFELMATLVLAQRNQEKVNDMLAQESAGILPFSSPKVALFFEQ
ncbi:uncharacterized protein ATC70_010282 [Mucor velutinosus]|uniref:Uncharacterized protein n=1 Tax=Mucor velutinosus TaxID=708070 RepID=A0AAN7DEH9_9FUNG|nr:hypothetical protein ATC70_010282 [Mucor velutinosus]